MFPKFWPNFQTFCLFQGKKKVNFRKILLRKSTFRFSRKNRPIFKTFCQNNEKFREKKKGLLPIYQGFLAFQSCQKSEPNNHPNYRSFDEREEDRKKEKSCFSMSLKVEKRFL